MTDPEVKILIDAYLDGALTQAQGKALNEWVKASPEHARAFARASWLHRQVYDAMHVRDLQQLSAGATEVEPDDILAHLRELEDGSGEQVLINLTPELERRKAERKRAERRARALQGRPSHDSRDNTVLVIPRLVVYAVAAVLVVGLLTAFYTGLLGGEKTPDPIAQNGTPRQSADLPPVVAELVGGNQPVWADVTQSARPGTPLRQGVIQLTSGTAEVRFQSGATAVFRAPAIIDLRSASRMALIQGSMVANVPERAQGFTVDTPSMRVVDLGTEFAMTADATGSSEVQVFVGEVNAAAYDASGQLGSTASIRPRRGLAVDGATFRARPIEADGRAFEDLAPHLALLHRNLVVNGDFEDGEPAAIRGQTLIDVQNLRVPGWEDNGPGTVLGYNSASVHDYPNPARHPMPDDRGSCYYSGMSDGEIRQSIDLSPLAALTDTGEVRFDLSAWLGGFGNHDEYIQATATFYDAAGRAIGSSVTLDPVRAIERGNTSGFLFRDREGRVPVGTRRVVIVLLNNGYQKPPYVQDGYADNIALELSVD